MISENVNKETNEVITEQSIVRNIGFDQSAKRPIDNKNFNYYDAEVHESNIVLDSEEN